MNFCNFSRIRSQAEEKWLCIRSHSSSDHLSFLVDASLIFILVKLESTTDSKIRGCGRGCISSQFFEWDAVLRRRGDDDGAVAVVPLHLADCHLADCHLAECLLIHCLLSKSNNGNRELALLLYCQQ